MRYSSRVSDPDWANKAREQVAAGEPLYYKCHYEPPPPTPLVEQKVEKAKRVKRVDKTRRFYCKKCGHTVKEGNVGSRYGLCTSCYNLHYYADYMQVSIRTPHTNNNAIVRTMMQYEGSYIE